MSFSRRSLLKAGGAAACAGSLGWLFRPSVSAQPLSLVKDPAGIIDLPAGFSYRVVQRVLEPMSDGFRTPARPDGMACFLGADGSWVLMRNHELDYASPLGAYDLPAPTDAYDAKTFGAVTRVVIDPQTLETISSNLVLTGTLRNCAGGKSPFGWLTCEESVDSGHGFVFLCDPASSELRAPHKIPGYGRFNHEAAAIDPRTHIAYLSEDRVDGCFYRFLPRDSASPFVGKLQALSVSKQPRFDTSALSHRGHALPVDWVDVPDPTPASDSVRLQAQERGAALVCRAEGVAFQDGRVFICATSGGPLGSGQIFELGPGTSGREQLKLIAVASDDQMLNHPDNITLTPWGHVLMAEDGVGEQHVRGLTPEGRTYEIARNAAGAGEFAGVCLSPDASVLFVNQQIEGITLAIRGPLGGLGV